MFSTTPLELHSNKYFLEKNTSPYKITQNTQRQKENFQDLSVLQDINDYVSFVENLKQF